MGHPPNPDVMPSEQSEKTLNTSELETLRRLLLGPEYQSLLSTKEILKDPKLLAKLITPAILEALQPQQSEHNLQKILTPTIVDALMDSVSDDPKPIADALYPVMGPAIRRSISATMNQMTRNFNELLEQSVSPKAWRWRFDAWRTGRSYSEVVLLNNLVYQVEQVFLIHSETGLLLQHVMADTAIIKDPDMVSGMLTAIQDFTQDSFAVEQDSGLNSLKLGDLTVLIENGPNAVIAAVVRGVIPSDLSATLTEIIEEIHLRENKQLMQYQGDSEQFSHLKPLLSECIKTQLNNKQKVKKETKGNGIFKPLLVSALMLGLLWYGYSWYQNNLQEEEWQQIQQSIQAEPGIHITNFTSENGKFKITGLRDPLAKKPSLLIKHGTLKHIEVDLALRPYLSLDTEIVLKRLRNSYDIPDSVGIRLDSSTLILTGRATQSWLNRFKSDAVRVDGISYIDSSRLQIVE